MPPSSVAAAYLANGLTAAEAEPPSLVLVQFLDAQRQVGRHEPAAHSVIKCLGVKNLVWIWIFVSLIALYTAHKYCGSSTLRTVLMCMRI